MIDNIGVAPLTITPDHAGLLHDAICRAIDRGLTVRPPQPDFRYCTEMTGRTYWTVDSASTPGAKHVVMVHELDGAVTAWCDCEAFRFGNVCRHIAAALDEMRLIPMTTGEDTCHADSISTTTSPSKRASRNSGRTTRRAG